MSYNVKRTEYTNPSKPDIVVEDQTVNTETSLTFVGKNYAGYATPLAENFLHLLENFANNTSPSRAIQGQLWYDNSPGVNLLKVYDGTTWTAAGSVKKASSEPGASSSTVGDLWVDTENQQLYVYSGSGWLLIGPQFSSGLKTGPDIETITDTSNVTHDVITMWSENVRVAIVSSSAFTPKQTISGFAAVNKGITLSALDTTNTKLWGTAEKAEALVISGSSVTASSFLRGDVTSTSNSTLNIRNNGGITIGSDLSFNIGTDTATNSTILYSKNSGQSINFRLTEDGTPSILLHLDSTNKVGINNTNPQEALDVTGNILTSGTVTVTNTTDATVLGGSASITTSGGLNVDKQIKVGGDITTYSKIYVNNLNLLGNPVAASVILPGSDDATNLYDIGSSARKFRNIYADSFVGSFTGSFSGTLNGSISGSAAKIASPTSFNITGDVSSTAPVQFDGQTGGLTKTFTTVISQDIISNKDVLVDSTASDALLVYRDGTGLRQTSKATFMSNVATVPVGAILPFAGITVPVGYLLCDGGEVRTGDYPLLFSTIGYTYKAAAALIGQGTFAVPDLRGRFPLGRDNMDNGNEVPDKNTPTIPRDAGGGSANRVTDVVADTLGAGTSTGEYKTLAVSNLPQHKHTLATAGADYFAVGRPGATSDPAGISPPGPGTTSAGLSSPITGDVYNSSVGQPFNAMNPYLTINYIIFTGAL